MKRTLMYSAAVSAVLFGAGGAMAQSTDANPDPVEVEDVIVTGVRASLAQALQIKRSADQVVESIVADDIGKLPDNNVVETLQRVTGVQISNRGGGEAGAIWIRGMPDITTTWNGRNVFTASGRQLALQDIPANLVRRIDVYKTRSADQIETGIAGQIDVFTRRPFDFDDRQFSMNLRGAYQEQGENFDPNGSILVSDRWTTGAGDFGALLNLSYVRTRYRAQNVFAGAIIPFASPTNPPPGFTPLERIFNTRGGVAENPIWQAGMDRGLPTAPGSTMNFNGVPYRYVLARDAVFASDLTGDRRRPAVNAALQWAPNDRSEYTLEFMYEGFRDERLNSLHFTFADWWGALGPDPASTIELFPDSNLIRSRVVGRPFGFQSGDYSKDSTDSLVLAMSGKWLIGDNLEVVADLSHQTSEFKTQFLAMRLDRVPEALAVNFNPGNGIPSWHFLDGAGNNADALLTDPASWNAAQFYDNEGGNKGDATTLSVDGDQDFAGNFGAFTRFSFGFRYDDRNASASNRNGPVGFLGRNLATLDSGLPWVNEGFFDGNADIPTSWLVPNGYYIAENADTIRALYGLPLSSTHSQVETFQINEVTAAAYAQMEAETQLFGRDLKAIAGVRWVHVKTDMNFTDYFSGVSSDAEQSVSELLPSVTAHYDLSEDFRLRFNFGQTLRRPNFGDLNPNFGLTEDLTGVGYGTGGGGNPDLEPTRSRNIDLTAEWYFARDSALYSTLFRREIEGLVVALSRRQTITGTGLNTAEFVVTQPVNASDGVLKGFEVGLVYFPDYLPGALDGLGVQASLTSLDSSQNIPLTDSAGNIVGEENTSFFGVSDLSYNVTLAYDRGPVSSRLSYVWREDFLNNNEARIFANPIGIWRQPEKSLDFQINYAINGKLAVSLDAVNLTDEINQSYYAFSDAGGPDTHNFGNSLVGRTFAVGLRYTY